MFANLSVSCSAGWRAVVACPQEDLEFVALWMEFKTHCEELSDCLGVAHHAFSLELCVDTWEQDSVVRVHGRLCVSADRIKMKLGHAKGAELKITSLTRRAEGLR